MNLEEFNKTSFWCGMQVEYKGQVYPVASVDFPEGLIGIQVSDDEDAEPEWKRCENCTLIPEAEPVPPTGAGLKYQKFEGLSAWGAYNNGKLIGKLVIEKSWNADLGADESKVFVSDHTKPNPALIPGSPFESMNKAKAVLEYHFRNLLDRRTEFAA